jgi:hypothetical protein
MILLAPSLIRALTHGVHFFWLCQLSEAKQVSQQFPLSFCCIPLDRQQWVKFYVLKSCCPVFTTLKSN